MSFWICQNCHATQGFAKSMKCFACKGPLEMATFHPSVGASARAIALAPPEFNLNEYVWVKLRKPGKDLLRAREVEWRKTSRIELGELKRVEQQEAENDGWSRWQLWSLMSDFGQMIYPGCNPPFETTIRFTDPAGEASVAPPAPQKENSMDTREVGYVIERYHHSILEYFDGHACPGPSTQAFYPWSEKHENAVRFARAEDASIIQAWFLKGEGRVVQHLWAVAPPPQEHTK